jgi:hypothetical protein
MTYTTFNGYSTPRRERRFTLNDTDRAQWVDNDEGLYNWMRGSRLSMRAFVRQNRAELDAYIQKALGHE